MQRLPSNETSRVCHIRAFHHCPDTYQVFKMGSGHDGEAPRVRFSVGAFRDTATPSLRLALWHKSRENTRIREARGGLI